MGLCVCVTGDLEASWHLRGEGHRVSCTPVASTEASSLGHSLMGREPLPSGVLLQCHLRTKVVNIVPAGKGEMFIGASSIITKQGREE